MSKVPYTTDPEYKQPTLLSLAVDLLLAVVGAGVIVGTVAYFAGAWK